MKAGSEEAMAFGPLLVGPAGVVLKASPEEALPSLAFLGSSAGGALRLVSGSEALQGEAGTAGLRWPEAAQVPPAQGVAGVKAGSEEAMAFGPLLVGPAGVVLKASPEEALPFLAFLGSSAEGVLHLVSASEALQGEAGTAGLRWPRGGEGAGGIPAETKPEAGGQVRSGLYLLAGESLSSGALPAATPAAPEPPVRAAEGRLAPRVGDEGGATSPLGLLRPPQAVTLRLSPPHLGQLQVQVRLDDERLTAAFVVESSAAQQLLRTHLPLLQHLLDQQGFAQPHLVLYQAAGNFAWLAGHGSAKQEAPSWAAWPPATGHGRAASERSRGAVRADQVRLVDLVI
ncbi:MAG: hypothetical protein KatS3mg131_1266 [Candidatus Tectimicrobiota bacterium]|nr:MAG: hypothetical protein KatS3mg131_1266 [Candidatus Tectomicrobia bacterium]